MRILIILAICLITIGAFVGLVASVRATMPPPEVVVIEGCEYFRFTTYGLYYGLCHKGNCKACEAKP